MPRSLIIYWPQVLQYWNPVIPKNQFDHCKFESANIQLFPRIDSPTLSYKLLNLGCCKLCSTYRVFPSTKTWLFPWSLPDVQHWQRRWVHKSLQVDQRVCSCMSGIWSPIGICGNTQTEIQPGELLLHGLSRRGLSETLNCITILENWHSIKPNSYPFLLCIDVTEKNAVMLIAT